MSWDWWNMYCDEAYGVISSDWLEKTGKSPSGFDLPTLLKDLGRL